MGPRRLRRTTPVRSAGGFHQSPRVRAYGRGVRPCSDRPLVRPRGGVSSPFGPKHGAALQGHQDLAGRVGVRRAGRPVPRPAGRQELRGRPPVPGRLQGRLPARARGPALPRGGRRPGPAPVGRLAARLQPAHLGRPGPRPGGAAERPDGPQRVGQGRHLGGRLPGRRKRGRPTRRGQGRRGQGRRGGLGGGGQGLVGGEGPGVGGSAGGSRGAARDRRNSGGGQGQSGRCIGRRLGRPGEVPGPRGGQG
mmetsp:Transcript_21641/g.48930  ORF Transcript_21641/g.48930 Transcript_21641/m.48930 type:complete len:250 (+) Transcript_21641:523-1272(+)